MMSYDFSTTAHAKWILAGEHAVIRGHPALVFPLLKKKISFDYQKSSEKLKLVYPKGRNDVIEQLFYAALNKALSKLKISEHDLHGICTLNCNIPIGVGLGASAALCVCLARWFAQEFPKIDVPIFARHLEDIFHGQSSGVDIAGASAASGVLFHNGQVEPIRKIWQPMWFLSSCRQIGITGDCTSKVNDLWKKSPVLAQAIDEKMTLAVLDSQFALNDHSTHAFDRLANAINQAKSCFYDWNLISESLDQHMKLLSQEGAVAVKPTGSGGGGFVLSLWATEPRNLRDQLWAV